MIARTRQIVTAFATAAVLGLSGGVLSAQVQDGLINVAIGDITIEDINVGAAALIAANACGLKVGPVAILGRAVDRSGSATTVCQSDQGPVQLQQN